MSCSTCYPTLNCGVTKTPSCEMRTTIDWVPNTACTIGVTTDGVTDTLELRQGIQNCQSKTHMTLNKQTGCIEYQNEDYIMSDGQAGYLETVCASELAGHIDLEDLGNVDDEKPENCAFLVYRQDSNCGPNCTSVYDKWVHWYAKDNLVTSMPYVMGFNDNECPVVLDTPADTSKESVLTWSGDGAKWQQMETSPEATFASILQTFHRGNGTGVGQYYAATSTQYDIHLSPDSRNGWVPQGVTSPDDGSCTDVDRDYVAIVHWCSDVGSFTDQVTLQMTPYNSSESFTAAMEQERASHADSCAGPEVSFPTSRSVKIPKGTHLVIHMNGSGNGRARLHQFAVTWIPGNIISSTEAN